MTARSGLKGRTSWRKYCFWAIGALVGVVVIWHAYYLYAIVGNGKIGFAKQTDVFPCGKGDYQLRWYEYSNGDGFVELTDHAGKVFGKATYSEGNTAGPFHWADDCKSVFVHTDADPVELKVK
jgi:hypothetical protein